MRARLRLGVVALFVLAMAAIVGGSGAPGTDVREAADLGQFRAGNIITDGVFYDTSTMNPDQIQAFLTSKNSGLRNLRMDTFTRTSSPCGQYVGAPQETAAWIIYKVAKACGINPQALLVILQKEQGLVTAGSPSYDQLRKAMGYGCPDTPAGCDATYNGFFNQLYMGARQFKLYQANPTKYGYVAGRTNSIAYQANAPDCGRASVFIENQATAGLYNYTPYVPNDPALRAGYGKGDVCSAYGNRNFFQYFVDWFGSTQSSGGSQIVDKYNALKAIGVDLGVATGDVRCDQPGGGCWRPYQGGNVYWSYGTGARVVRGAILDRYWQAGGPGALGYPVTDDALAPGGQGFVSTFQGGDIWWSSATGAQIVRGGILDFYRAWGGPTGALGYPVTSDGFAPGGQGFVVDFQGGSVYWSQATGGHVVRGALLARYRQVGGPAALGYPTGDDQSAPGGGFMTPFQGGDLYWSPATGAKVVRGAILAAYRASGGPAGLGYPTGDDQAAPGGKGFLTSFERGDLYWSAPTGAHVVRGALLARYRELGGPEGLGYPTGDDQPAAGGGYMTPFQSGHLYWSGATGVHVVRGAILAQWERAGGSGGYLGFPVTDDAPAPGGRGYVVDFQGGAVYWSAATDTRIVRGAILQKYRAAGGPPALGYPTSDDRPVGDGRGYVTSFQNADVVWSADTGAQVVRGAIHARWTSSGGARGYLGYPVTSDASAPGGGFVVDFQGGAVYWSAATDTRVVRGGILAAYRAAGGPAALGYPTRDDEPVGDGRGYRTTFQYGDVYWSAATGAQIVRGGINGLWVTEGGPRGYLGYPVTSDAPTPGGGYVVDFEGGSIYWSPTSGSRIVRGGILAAYRAGGGPAVIGLPVTSDGPAPGGNGYVVRFDGGSIYWSAATGAHIVLGAVDDAYRAAGSTTSSYGYPVSDTYADGSGQRVDFQQGAITR